MPEPEMLIDGESGARWTIVLAHGAGQGMHAPFMQAVAGELVALGGRIGGLRVVRFEFPYMAARAVDGKRRPPDRQPKLLAAWREVISILTASGAPLSRMVIGGKSMGGRMASLIADEAGVAGLCCLGYPFHPPGKPDRLRTEHLRELTTPTLICQGERDPFGARHEVSEYTLSDAVRLHWLPDGDHGFKPRKASGRTADQNRAVAVEAMVDFIGTLG